MSTKSTLPTKVHANRDFNTMNGKEKESCFAKSNSTPFTCNGNSGGSSSSSSSSSGGSGASNKIAVLDKVNIGDNVYVPEGRSDEPWRLAVVEDISQYYGRDLLRIRFLNDENGKRLVSRSVKSMERDVKLEFVAYVDEKPHIFGVICVGVRVIANIRLNSVVESRIYFSGIVAEPPIKNLNGGRYLVFFDNGRAEYVQPADVRLIAKHTLPSWANLSPNIQQFVEEYVRNYPTVKKATLRKFFIISVEWNGIWWPARVVDIDCSLAKFEFLHNSLTLWIHKGSPRLLMNNKILEQGKRNPEALINCCSEYEGKVQQRKIPEECTKLGRINKRPHLCDSNCAPSPWDKEELRDLSPFAIPLFYGWKRIVNSGDQQEGTFGPVYYVAPCSKQFFNYEDLLEFIDVTSSDFLEIDNFTFDPEVDCLAEFEVKAKPFLSEEDISEGQEKPARIERINTLDDKVPNEFLYSPSNILDSDVPQSTDTGFLVCCDCPNDCRDKENCPCFRLSAENEPELEAKFGKNMTHFGYEYRRLKNPHVSGIYECNAMCKCKTTCINRVVQRGIKFKLQVFKTSRNGYALRTMQDIPLGSFICTYSGLLLPNYQADIRVSNEDYFTNLDLIEIYDTYKPDYEPYAIEPEEVEIPQKGKRGRGRGRGRKNLSKNRTTVDDTLGNSSRSAISSSKRGKKAGRGRGGKMKNGNGEASESQVNQHANTNGKQVCVQRHLLFGDEEDVYVIDSKNVGNVGRFMNHSCTPNVSGQNVFIESHDLRFPIVAFFATTFIKAGSELTWNYNYQVGSVPGKIVPCNCGSATCKKRLF